MTPVVAGTLLLLVYLASMAPGVTLWDAGEFIAAVRTLGIPHPPGTPLFILIGRAWTLLLGFLPTAFALNLMSGVCTAVAGALTATFVFRSTGSRPVAIAAALIAGTMSTAWLNATETEVYAASLLLGFLPTAFALNLMSGVCTAVAGALTATFVFRSTGSRPVAIAAALVAGTMSTAWLNATETEVYAASLLLSMAMLLAADQAGRTGEERWTILCSYLIALSVPLHLSALVAAPAAIMLAADRVLLEDFGSSSQGTRGGWLRMMATLSWPWVFLLAGATVLAIAASGASRLMLLVGASLLALSAQSLPRGSRSRIAIAVPVVLLAFSVLAFMIIRASHDPGINQGDPSTLERWMSVITREQYAVAPLWPRQTPLWMQLANMLQYFDWQLALSLEPEPPLSAGRGAATIIGVVLALVGSAEHRRADPRRWRALLILLLSGSVGVMLYLNLKAGPSIGWGILPERAPHEPRERDYFFVLAFWVWGIWIAMGVASVVERLNRLRPTHFVLRPATGYGLRAGVISVKRLDVSDVAVLLVAMLPVVLNWKAVERRSEPGASLARTSGLAFLASAPPRAVLFVAGDNDSYPLWYLQHVEHFRTDVTVVTIPIIPADWYRDELARRHGLHTPDKWVGLSGEMSAIASDARRQGRPVVAAVSVDPSERAAIGGISAMRGWVWTLDTISQSGVAPNVLTASRFLDSIPGLTRVERAALIASPDSIPAARLRYLSPAERYMLRLLACPRLAKESAYHKMAADSLDLTCNFR